MAEGDSARRKLARLDKSDRKVRTERDEVDQKTARKEKEAEAKRRAAVRTSSPSLRRSRLKQAERREKEVRDLREKAADLTTSLTRTSRQRGQVEKQLRRAEARERMWTAPPTLRHVKVVRQPPPPAPETLRVLYLLANPHVYDGRRLRPEVEVCAVREFVERSPHGGLVDIRERHAATFDDFAKELVRFRPHVVHFAGHATPGSLEFDNAKLGWESAGVPVPFEAIAQALAESEVPVRLLVLNACESLERADIFLESVPAVIGTTRIINDTEATLFASHFYEAVASGESIRTAIEAGKDVLEKTLLVDGDVIESLKRDDVDLADQILVKLADAAAS